MISGVSELFTEMEQFADSGELAEALRKIVADGGISPVTEYYLIESADHIESMFSLLMEMARGLAVNMKEKKA